VPGITYITSKTGRAIHIWPPVNAQSSVQILAPRYEGNYGNACIERFKYTLRDVLRYKWDWLFLTEHDAICLEPDLTQLQIEEAWWGIVSEGQHESRFVVAPHFIPRSVLNKVVSVMDNIPITTALGDEWIATVMRTYGIPYRHYGDLSWRNHKTGLLTPSDVPSVRAAVLSGATIIHGIKDAAGFAAVMRAAAEAKAAGGAQCLS
jgi:hypothetical protein